MSKNIYLCSLYEKMAVLRQVFDNLTLNFSANVLLNLESLTDTYIAS